VVPTNLENQRKGEPPLEEEQKNRNDQHPERLFSILFPQMAKSSSVTGIVQRMEENTRGIVDEGREDVRI
jgi:hypothetical protein